jgi:hypothetical protein
MLGEGSKPGMVGDVIVIDIDALRDLVVEGFLFGCAKDRQAGYCDGDALFAPKQFVAFSERGDILIEIAGGCIWLLGDYFEHPRSILIDDWKR